MIFSNFAIEKLRTPANNLFPLCNDLDKKVIILTGATGFFGTWLLSLFEILNDLGLQIKVIAISRNPEAYLIKESRFRDATWLRWHTCDLTELTPTLACADHSDYIIHAATDTSPEARATPAKLFWSITDSWRSILALAKKTHCRRVLLISSGAVYGKITEHGARESDLSMINFSQAPNPYAFGKQVCEQSAWLENGNKNLDIIVTRCFSFIGPGLPLNQGYAAGNFVWDIAMGQDIRIKSDGKAVRSFLHPCDLVIWLITILLKGEQKEIYNVGSEKTITIADLANLIRNVLKSPMQVIIEGGRSTGIGADIYFPQTKKARALGLSETCTLEESIIELANSVRPGYNNRDIHRSAVS